MKRLKDIERELDKREIEHWREENGQRLVFRSCEIGNNFYDYEDEPPANLNFALHPDLAELEDDPRIYILWCSDCCGCAGW